MNYQKQNNLQTCDLCGENSWYFNLSNQTCSYISIFDCVFINDSISFSFKNFIPRYLNGSLWNIIPGNVQWRGGWYCLKRKEYSIILKNDFHFFSMEDGWLVLLEKKMYVRRSVCGQTTVVYAQQDVQHWYVIVIVVLAAVLTWLTEF